MELISIPAVLAIVEAVKRMGLDSRFAPMLSIVIGVLLGFAFVEGTWLVRLAVGLVLGLSASGLYSGAKATFGK